MIDKELARECKHSFAILLGFVGQNTPANKILLKWPDLIDAVIDKDQARVDEALHFLMCYPLKLLAESLNETAMAGVDEEVESCYGLSDYGRSKQKLIEICNRIIDKLNERGQKIDRIISLNNGR